MAAGRHRWLGEAVGTGVFVGAASVGSAVRRLGVRAAFVELDGVDVGFTVGLGVAFTVVFEVGLGVTFDVGFTVGLGASFTVGLGVAFTVVGRNTGANVGGGAGATTSGASPSPERPARRIGR